MLMCKFCDMICSEEKMSVVTMCFRAHAFHFTHIIRSYHYLRYFTISCKLLKYCHIAGVQVVSLVRRLKFTLSIHKHVIND